MVYRVVVPKAAGRPFIQTAETASEALTKLHAAQTLFGQNEVYVEREDGTVVTERQLAAERQADLTTATAAAD